MPPTEKRRPQWGLAGVMWCLLGHDDPDDLKDGKCSRCGAKFYDWRVRVVRQRAATQADCCQGFVLEKPAGGGA